jgi:hypothetical protein
MKPILSILPLLVAGYLQPLRGSSPEAKAEAPHDGKPVQDPNKRGADHVSGKAGAKKLAPNRKEHTTGDDARDRQLRAARNTLLERAQKAATLESERTGRDVQPEEVPSLEELAKGYTMEDSELRMPVQVEARPGETISGPVTGVFARTRVVPEHQITGVSPVPTFNAPGLGADSGLKLTPDNADASGGPKGHIDGADPADPVVSATNPNAVAGIAGVHADTRNDTREANAERMAESAKAVAEAKAADGGALEQVRVQENQNRTAGQQEEAK